MAPRERPCGPRRARKLVNTGDANVNNLIWIVGVAAVVLAVAWFFRYR
jgi:LPXTG-motif cell wall-anchored protein